MGTVDVGKDGSVLVTQFTGDLHLHLHFGDEEQLAMLSQLISGQAVIIKKEIDMSVELDTLKAQAQKNEDAEAAAITLLNGLSAQITALKDDPVALAKLATDLKGSADALGAAIVANTPAENPPGGPTGATGGTGATGPTGGVQPV